MVSIHIPRPWETPERLVTPEAAYLDRRRFLQALGLASGALLLGSCARAQEQPSNRASGPFTKTDFPGAPGLDLYPGRSNANYKVDRPLTDEATASKFNNFYEFSMQKDVYKYVRDYKPYPWTVEVGGLCSKPKTWDLDELVRRFGLEERVYHFRCVEAWSMVVPWTGLPLAALLQASAPATEAQYVRFLSFLRPDEAPGQKQYHWYKWPYYEGLRLDEAMHELAFVATGIYGHPLPKQHGAPVRIITPWKYGYKGPKSVVKIEFTRDRPHTFWNDSQPDEYGFHSNVNPERPHPRWSQATERVLGTDERVTTLKYNGYAAQVVHLYAESDPF